MAHFVSLTTMDIYFGMPYKRSKWMKVPRRVEEAWDNIRKKVTHDSRKREFKRKLMHGNRRGTIDPGPH